MLPKRSRLTKQSIEQHLKHARRVKTAHFLVIYGSNPVSPMPQVSFSASKKVAKTAVLRNKLRRRGYAGIKPILPHIRKNTLVLISYLNPWTDGSLDEMRIEIQAVFQKIQILNT